MHFQETSFDFTFGGNNVSVFDSSEIAKSSISKHGDRMSDIFMSVLSNSECNSIQDIILLGILF
jgi:hypothetical protein